MVTFTQFLETFYELWLSMFQGLPYGDPYIAWAVLAMILAIFGWALKLIFEREA